MASIFIILKSINVISIKFLDTIKPENIFKDLTPYTKKFI